jgi:hypothetical protein
MLVGKLQRRGAVGAVPACSIFTTRTVTNVSRNSLRNEI